jgi:16S rRNA (guanine966-N2)-methyltransferase
VREAIFNALQSMGAVEGATVLDLFAGSGALGIEALSRGAASATFVDHDRRAVEVVRANLAATGFGPRSTVVRADAATWLAGPGAGPVDLALLDPPYATDDEAWATLLGRLDASVVVVEADSEPTLPAGWEVVRSRRYGSTVVTIACPEGPSHP